MNETVSKPLIVAMNEAEAALFKSVNEIMRANGIPCYLFEMIFDKVHRQIKDGAEQELNHSIAQYAQDVANAEKQPDEEEKAGVAE